MSKTHKQAALFLATHALLEEIMESDPLPGKDGFVPVGNRSKAKIIHMLVSEHHKKVVKGK